MNSGYPFSLIDMSYSLLMPRSGYEPYIHTVNRRDNGRKENSHTSGSATLADFIGAPSQRTQVRLTVASQTQAQGHSFQLRKRGIQNS